MKIETEKNSDKSIINMEDIKSQVKVIVEKYHPQKIILFGSYAKGNPTQESDVDLLVVIDSDQSSWELGVEISLLLTHSFPMDIIVRTPQEISKRLKYGDFFIKDILENGIILYERTC